MIIRKPYAFLIKYFKVIHLILFFGILYLLFRTKNIFEFFKDFSSTGTYTYIENLALKYINPIMIVIAILLVGLFLLIYFLMKQKEKKVLYYLMAIIFYSLSFVLYLFFLSVFNNLEFTSYNNQSLVLFRDLSRILYYVNYIFLVVAFVRGFGFNVRKFNFEKDLKDLDISDEDREEIEVSSNIDYENISNFVRRRKRNFKYYIKENSFVLTIFLIMILFSTSAYIAYRSLVTDKVYQEKDYIFFNDLYYTVKRSYLTDKDFYGNIIKKDKYYCVVEVEVVNNTSEKYKYELNNSRLKVQDSYYYSKNNMASKFEDLGNVYKNQIFLPNTTNKYILIFEVDNISNDIVFELYEGVKEVGEEAIFYYKDYLLNPYSFKEQDLGVYSLNDPISLEKTLYQEGIFTIFNYETVELENYSYSKCEKEICNTYNASIVAKKGKSLLKIDYDGNKDIFKFLNIEGNKSISQSEIENVTPVNYKENTIILEIPETSDITLLFNIRNTIIRVKK